MRVVGSGRGVFCHKERSLHFCLGETLQAIRDSEGGRCSGTGSGGKWHEGSLRRSEKSSLIWYDPGTLPDELVAAGHRLTGTRGPRIQHLVRIRRTGFDRPETLAYCCEEFEDRTILPTTTKWAPHSAECRFDAFSKATT